MNMDKNLFEQFGAQFELGQFYPSYERKFHVIIPEFLVPGNREVRALDANVVATWYWCDGDKGESRKLAAKCVEHGIDYFFGDWRNEVPTDLKTIDPSWWRKYAAWQTAFRLVVCWASALADWNAVQRFCGYPSKDTKHGVDGSREDAAAYLALASLVRKAPAAEYEHCFQTIAKSKKQKPRYIAALVRALASQNQAEFRAGLEAYLKYFRQHEFNRRSITRLLCYDGTTLVNLGKQQGFKIDLPGDLSRYLIQF